MNGDQPAFPTPFDDFKYQPGMTYRQYAAAQALVGLLYDRKIEDRWRMYTSYAEAEGKVHTYVAYSVFAEQAVKLADALILALDKAETMEQLPQQDLNLHRHLIGFARDVIKILKTDVPNKLGFIATAAKDRNIDLNLP